MNETQQIVADYIRKGYAPIPVPAEEKNPNRPGWQNERWTVEDVPQKWNDSQNTGLLTGESSDWLVDVDFDVPEASAIAGRFLQPTLTSGRASNPHSHWWYEAKNANSETWKDVDGTVLVELRAGGRQTLVAPSVHPSGEACIWHDESGLEAVKADALELHSRVRELATSVLIARHLPEHRSAGGGGRHGYALAVAGYLLRRLDGELVEKILVAAWDAKGWADGREVRERREAVQDIEGIVRDTAAKIERGAPVQGGPTLEESAPGMVNRLSRWWGWSRSTVIQGEFTQSESTPEPDWEEPIALPEGLPHVAPFDPGMLPGPLRAWTLDVAKRMQIPPDFVAAGAVVVAGSLIGRKFGMMPKMRDDWLVIPNLWGAVVGRPSMLKSPALAEVMRPLERLAHSAREEHEAAISEHGTAIMISEAERHALEGELKKAAKGCAQTGDRSELEKLAENFQNFRPPEEPKLRRYKSEDPTVEKLCDLLRENPQGLLVHRDELSGWLRSLDKQGREGDRSLYLEAWNGTGSYEVDRIGRGSLYIPALCVSILGGIQPGPLSTYVYGANGGRGGERDDGLLQRFQILVWPDAPKTWLNVDLWPNTEAKNRAFGVFSKLDELTADDFGAEAVDENSVPAVRFTSEAQQVFDSWREKLERRLRSGELNAPLEAHLAKYRSLMPSLALIFQAVEYVGGGERGAVGAEAARRAVTWCEYLESHAHRLYASAERPELAGARALLAKVMAGGVEDGSTLRSIYRNQWSLLTTVGEATGAATVLEDFNWIRVETAQTGGRPTQRIRLHPTVRGEAHKGEVHNYETDKTDITLAS